MNEGGEAEIEARGIVGPLALLAGMSGEAMATVIEEIAAAIRRGESRGADRPTVLEPPVMPGEVRGALRRLDLSGGEDPDIPGRIQWPGRSGGRVARGSHVVRRTHWPRSRGGVVSVFVDEGDYVVSGKDAHEKASDAWEFARWRYGRVGRPGDNRDMGDGDRHMLAIRRATRELRRGALCTWEATVPDQKSPDGRRVVGRFSRVES